MGVKLSSLPRKVWNEPGTLKLVGYANAMNLREVRWVFQRWWEGGWDVRGVHLCHPKRIQLIEGFSL